MSNIFIPRHELENLILSAFLNSDVSETNAASVAAALTQAQMDGQV
ncbi:MAG: Ldh family oxidoreductase, partial [Gammaproteobacteria bacterium]|nr:Ldh family oxidoreductase [Gammaproteobacteria bacterium]